MDIFGDQTIKPGDLAMVVRDCCGRYLGVPIKVRSIFNVSEPKSAMCGHCQRTYSNITMVEVESPTSLWYGPLFWMKKIEPPAEYERGENREELTA